MELPWGHARPFNAYSEYLKKRFGFRLQKLSVDAGFTCPNRDGTKSFGGCTYCDNSAFNPSYCQGNTSVSQQIKDGICFHKNRYRRAGAYLAYFQAFSNTYAPLETLKRIYCEALNVEGVIGLVIGTRPDCVDEYILDYLKELSEKYYIVLEYGVESVYNRTLKRINRAHTFEDTCRAIQLALERQINIGIHLIFGLPGESKGDILSSLNTINSLNINTIKFHQLQLIKNTPMARDYGLKPDDFTFFELDEYTDFIISYLEGLNPDYMIERLAGEVPPRFLAREAWGLIRYDQVLRMIENRMTELKTWQGKYYKGS